MSASTKTSTATKAYRFGRDSSDNAFLEQGWGEPERGFVWSEGKLASVRLPKHSAKIALSASLWGYVPPESPKQEVLVFVDGLFKGLFEVHDKTVVLFNHVSRNDVEDVEIVFYIPTCTSPSIAEGSSDGRRLGIALAVIQVSERQHATS